MDRFRLVRPASILTALAYGALAAGLSLWVNEWLLHVRHVPPDIVRRYIAPATEETAKAGLLVALIATSRVGFLVDAAVQGFAVGTGFALAENVWYLRSMPDAAVTLWIVRGLGTAVLQGATTSIFAIVSRALADRHPDRPVSRFVPGWAAAVAVHSAFNHRLLPPFAEMLVMLIALPL